MAALHHRVNFIRGFGWAYKREGLYPAGGGLISGIKKSVSKRATTVLIVILKKFEKTLLSVKKSLRSKALQNKTATSNSVLPSVTTFNPATPNLKKILMKHWHLITENNKLAQTFPKPPIVAYRKEKSLKDILVRAKIPSRI